MTNGRKIDIQAPELSVKALDSKYNLIMQSPATNEAARLTDKRKTDYDIVTDEATLQHKDVTAIVAKYKDGKPFTTTEAIIFDYVVVLHTGNGNKKNDNVVTFSVDDYMQARGLKDRKSARKQLDEGLKTLIRTSLNFSGGVDETDKRASKSKRPKNFSMVNLLQSAEIKNGQATVQFTDKMNVVITGGMPMPLHSMLFKINTHKHPHSYYLLRKILENKRINYGEARADRISVNALLKACPSLPTYDEVAKSNRHFTDRIIEPFFTDLGVLAEAIEYSFIHPNGTPYDTSSYDNLTFDDFKGSMLVINEWKDYPNKEVQEWMKTKKTYQKKIASKRPRSNNSKAN